MITVKLEPSYDVLVGAGVLKLAGARMAEALPKLTRAVVVTDKKVKKLWGEKLMRSLREGGIKAEVIEIGDGEKTKDLKTITWLMSRFTALKLDRNSAVIALGGGVVGDTAGFAAAIYMRGVPVVQVPTTLLAQVDASIGGKTGVNLPAGKNLVGSFHQPKMVLADVDVLRTLSPREFRAGLYEVIKCGVIRDEKLFRELSAGETTASASEAILERIIGGAARVKAEIVAADEREGGLRRLLNFGHTIGHALEAATRYRRYLHGEAVALGMIAAAEVGRLCDVTPKDVAREIIATVRGHGKLPRVDLDAKTALRLIAGDKKSVAGIPHFVLATKIGDATVTDRVSAEAVRGGMAAIRGR